MPDCTELWNEVDRQSALVDAAGEAYEQAATFLMFHTQNLVAAIEAAMACESGQLNQVNERSTEQPEQMTLRRITKALKAIAKKR